MPWWSFLSLGPGQHFDSRNAGVVFWAGRWIGVAGCVLPRGAPKAGLRVGAWWVGGLCVGGFSKKRWVGGFGPGEASAHPWGPSVAWPPATRRRRRGGWPPQRWWRWPRPSSSAPACRSTPPPCCPPPAPPPPPPPAGGTAPPPSAATHPPTPQEASRVCMCPQSGDPVVSCDVVFVFR